MVISWKEAGFNYLRFSNVAARVTRQALKKEFQEEAAKRNVCSIEIGPYVPGGKKKKKSKDLGYVTSESGAQMEDTIKMFGPLNFEDSSADIRSTLETPCLLCDDSFNLKLCFNIFLKHCFEVHHLIIEDIQNISNLHEYIQYWKKRFVDTLIETIIPAVAVDTTDNKFFFISTLIKEDKSLRHKLKLDEVMKQQEFERTDQSYKCMCLFCSLQFEGVRSNYINHLSREHNFQVGNPQNLVFIDELIDRVQSKLNDLQCIYCEKTFPDRRILKEHMRKKMHKTINPQNKSYDKFYIINYLEPDLSWKTLEKEEDAIYVKEQNSEDEYSDWNEEKDKATCLFCVHKEPYINNLCLHMRNSHNFDFKIAMTNLDFYQKIKLINYMRRQVHNFHCTFCNNVFTDYNTLTNHMVNEGHYKLPALSLFDQPEYYFPTYENDAFLYYLEDIED